MSGPAGNMFIKHQNMDIFVDVFISIDCHETAEIAAN
jgi:hypothetical protein